MTNLTAKTEELVGAAKELMDTCVSKAGLDAFKYASTEELDLMQKALKLYDSSMELAVMQAEALDELNKKLNKVLSILETRV